MTDQHRTDPSNGHHAAGHAGHNWMMIACCIPMIVIAVALVATGAVSPGFLVAAVACTAMMVMMMGAMAHGGGARVSDDRSSHAGHVTDEGP